MSSLDSRLRGNDGVIFFFVGTGPVPVQIGGGIPHSPIPPLVAIPAQAGIQSNKLYSFFGYNSRINVSYFGENNGKIHLC